MRASVVGLTVSILAAMAIAVAFVKTAGAQEKRDGAQPAAAQQPGTAAQTGVQKKPNILVIMGDDIGWFNPSCYNSGIMGYKTPNIDRIANEGAIFTDYYGQQSCTAGRAAFITGQSPMRTGLLKVGLPAMVLYLAARSPRCAIAYT